jgi:hypothetical protein
MTYIIEYLTITFKRKQQAVESNSAQDAERTFKLLHPRTDRIQNVRRKIEEKE